MTFITLINAEVTKNHELGNDWNYYAKVNNVELKKGSLEMVPLKNGQLIFQLHAEAHDRTVPDITKNKKVKSYEDILGKTIYLNAEITENRGPHAGKTAIVTFTFEVE